MSKRKAAVSFSFLVDKPVEQLVKGDRVTTKKGKSAVITDHFQVHGRRVFVTDRFGRIFDYELAVRS